MIAYPLRVLFIDDDKVQADQLSAVLRKKIAPAALETFYASTREQGIRKSHELLPCIVFYDLLYPECGDWRASAKMIELIKGAVVVVTQLDTPEIEMECRAYGAIDVFNKSKILGIIEIVVRVITNIRLNALAREAVKSK